MSISRRTRRLGSNARRAITSNGVFLLLMITPFDVRANVSSSPPPAIACTVQVPALVEVGQPIMLAVSLQNRSSTAMAVLNWGTPFEEAWLQPFVEVQRDGRPLTYRGASVKRGDPDLDEYFDLAPGQQRTARLDLTEVFDFTIPGRYSVAPRLVLQDVVMRPATAPRLREAHVAFTPRCGGERVIVVRAAKK